MNLNKFVSSKEEIKEQFLYAVHDTKGFSFLLEVQAKTETSWYIEVIDDKDPEEIGEIHEFSYSSISEVKEDHLEFDPRIYWAFYEIGHKDNHPEYFL